MAGTDGLKPSGDVVSRTGRPQICRPMKMRTPPQRGRRFRLGGDFLRPEFRVVGALAAFSQGEATLVICDDLRAKPADGAAAYRQANRGGDLTRLHLYGDL